MSWCPGPGPRHKAKIKGLCVAHYMQARRYPGQPLQPLRKDRAVSVLLNVRVPAGLRKQIRRAARGARQTLSAWVRDALAAHLALYRSHPPTPAGGMDPGTPGDVRRVAERMRDAVLEDARRSCARPSRW